MTTTTHSHKHWTDKGGHVTIELIEERTKNQTENSARTTSA